MTARATVLFICEHNAGRSQLGAHLLALRGRPHHRDEREDLTRGSDRPRRRR